MTTHMDLSSYKTEGSLPGDFPASWSEEFNNIISKDQGYFYLMPEKVQVLADCQKVYEKFKDKKYFIHVGIGGSSLGPEMIVDALAEPDIRKKMTFLSNIEPDWVSSSLSGIPLKDSVFYFVSKSGNTMESISLFLAIKNEFQTQGIEADSFKDHMIFCTGPSGGVFNDLVKEFDLTKLEIPVPLGGRYSFLSAVGALPCLFAGIDPKSIWEGASDLKANLEKGEFRKSFFSLVHLLNEHNKKGVNQTVLMPYSSRLKKFTEWFVQLWSESLGKKYNLDGEKVNTGLTPISSVGATDQHSQMQLFMEGPQDKFLFFMEVINQAKDFSIDHELKISGMEMYQGRKLTEIFKAELEGTIKAFDEANLPHLRLSIDRVDGKNMGRLIFFFECLTVLMGVALRVNPFDQPGVEASKINANNWLANS